MRVKERRAVEKEVEEVVAEVRPTSLAVEDSLVRYSLTVFALLRKKVLLID